MIGSGMFVLPHSDGKVWGWGCSTQRFATHAASMALPPCTSASASPLPPRDTYMKGPALSRGESSRTLFDSRGDLPANATCDFH
jgi:hypothetical protein